MIAFLGRIKSGRPHRDQVWDGSSQELRRKKGELVNKCRVSCLQDGNALKSVTQQPECSAPLPRTQNMAQDNLQDIMLILSQFQKQLGRADLVEQNSNSRYSGGRSRTTARQSWATSGDKTKQTNKANGRGLCVRPQVGYPETPTTPRKGRALEA